MLLDSFELVSNTGRKVSSWVSVDKGSYISISTKPDGIPIMGYLLMDDGEIKSVWIDSDFRRNYILTKVYEESLSKVITSGQFISSTGSLYSIIHPTNERCIKFVKRLKPSRILESIEMEGEKWIQGSISVKDLLKC